MSLGVEKCGDNRAGLKDGARTLLVRRSLMVLQDSGKIGTSRIKAIAIGGTKQLTEERAHAQQPTKSFPYHTPANPVPIRGPGTYLGSPSAVL